MGRCVGNDKEGEAMMSGDGRESDAERGMLCEGVRMRSCGDERGVMMWICGNYRRLRKKNKYQKIY